MANADRQLPRRLVVWAAHPISEAVGLVHRVLSPPGTAKRMDRVAGGGQNAGSGGTGKGGICIIEEYLHV